MLKGELIRSRLDKRRGEVRARRLRADYHWLEVAEGINRLLRTHVGRTRGEVDEALRAFEGDSLDYPIIRGLAAVALGGCDFGREPVVGPAEARAALWARGPAGVGVIKSERRERAGVLREVAAGYGVGAAELEAAMFADLAEEQILQGVEQVWAPADLIGRYNLEVARGVLYWGREMRLWLGDHYKDIFKYIKLFKLMHEIREGAGGGYEVTLYGPLSPFVTSTIRYGLAFAKFMPALLLADEWRMEADVRPPGVDSLCRYRLASGTDLATHFKGSGAFDSKLEADFAAEFEAKYTQAERVWELGREDEMILVGDTVMIPDFSLTNKRDGRRVLIEIVGFWHPKYIERKLAKVAAAGREDLILLIYEGAKVAEGA
ncbi:MAG TPA: DUF790 family protein, partial [Anaerolineae bacterium]|nr:DUF790 family protein [Anaerolineae bacterium]